MQIGCAPLPHLRTGYHPAPRIKAALKESAPMTGGFFIYPK